MELTQDVVKELFDYKDGVLIWKKTGTKRQKIGSEAGFLIHSSYRKVTINGKRFYVHRIIFLWHKGYLPKFVDHINGDAADNRIENLREATKQQNQFNQKIRKTNKSGVKGVCWHKQLKKWNAYIHLNYKKIHLGWFDLLEDAEKAVKKKRKEIHGDFAKHK